GPGTGAGRAGAHLRAARARRAVHGGAAAAQRIRRGPFAVSSRPIRRRAAAIRVAAGAIRPGRTLGADALALRSDARAAAQKELGRGLPDGAQVGKNSVIAVTCR